MPISTRPDGQAGNHCKAQQMIERRALTDRPDAQGAASSMIQQSLLTRECIASGRGGAPTAAESRQGLGIFITELKRPASSIKLARVAERRGAAAEPAARPRRYPYRRVLQGLGIVVAELKRPASSSSWRACTHCQATSLTRRPDHAARPPA